MSLCFVEEEHDTPLRTQRIVAFIPARGGSKRIPRKNLRDLGGKPLVAWTIEAALGVGLRTFVSTEDEETAHVAKSYGASVIPTPLEVAHKDMDPDIKWVGHALEQVDCDAFMILRPTSPFRSADTIRRALKVWEGVPPLTGVGPLAGSLRAVTPVRQHPAKMWTIHEGERTFMVPVMLGYEDGTPWHSMPTQALPKVYVQTAGLEIAWRDTVERTGTISGLGVQVVPFIVEGLEALDINDESDFEEAEALCQSMRTPIPA